DDIIKMISDKGGVIMVTFNPGFISDKYNLTRTKAYEEYKIKEKQLKVEFGDNEEELEKKLDAIWSEMEPETVSMEELIDHIDYIINLVGPNHVGIGSDYGGTSPPKGLETAALYPNITTELVKRGYHEEDIFKILGKNLYRIIEKGQSFNNIS
ncbi:MAG: membrane dipeptidase, partial [Promethearchaeota archaeon]